MALPNTAQLTSQLASMPDSALKQMAMMHKNDPYTLPLIIAEDGRRKQLRQAAQMAAYQPQPKVVDQAAAAVGSLPEQQGIGMLPAQNIAQMADGGIAGYADGELVASNEPVVRMADGGVARYQYGGYASDESYDMSPLPAEAWERSGPSSLERFAQWAGRNVERDPATGEVVRKGPVVEKQRKPATASKFGDYGPSMYGSEESATDGKTALKADAARRTAPRADTGTGLPTYNAPSDLQAIFKKLQGDTALDKEALRKQREEYATGLTDYAAKELEEFDAAQAKRGDPFKGREARYAEQEGKLARMKDENLGLALLQAGAAIASTPGSLGVALGKGVNVGAAHYAAGIDKLNAAQDRLMDARDKLDELRMNREDMTAKERRALTSQANRAMLEGKKLFLDGAEKDFGYKREDTKTMFDAVAKQVITREETASRERIAAMPTGDMRAAMLLGTGRTDAEKLESGMKKLQDITSDKSGMKAAELLLKLNAEERKNNEPLSTMADLLGMMRSYSALTKGTPKAIDTAKPDRQ